MGTLVMGAVGLGPMGEPRLALRPRRAGVGKLTGELNSLLRNELWSCPRARLTH
jgi:hypothetical protein